MQPSFSGWLSDKCDESLRVSTSRSSMILADKLSPVEWVGTTYDLHLLTTSWVIHPLQFEPIFQLVCHHKVLTNVPQGKFLLKVMWPDRELNPRPPRSIPGALTTELYGQGYMAYLGGVDPSTSLRTSEVRCKDYTTQQWEMSRVMWSGSTTLMVNGTARKTQQAVTTLTQCQ